MKTNTTQEVMATLQAGARKRPELTAVQASLEAKHLGALLDKSETPKRMTRRELEAENARLRAQAKTSTSTSTAGTPTTAKAKADEINATRKQAIQDDAAAKAKATHQRRLNEAGSVVFRQDMKAMESIQAAEAARADAEADAAEQATAGRTYGPTKAATGPAGRFPHLARLAVLDGPEREAYRVEHVREIVSEIRQQGKEQNRPKQDKALGPCHREYRALMDRGEARLARRFWREHADEIKNEASQGA